jgi:hypothetical protein
MMLLANPRFWLAGPLTLLASYALMAGMPAWLPSGAAGINHLAFPLILFPALWAVLFFYCCLAENLRRVTLVLTVITIVNLGLAANAIWGA